MKALSRTLFAAYLFILLWLVLFKLSDEPLALLHYLQTRNLNLIPFASSRTHEMIANVAVFIPFGVMLGVCFKQILVRYAIAVILAFSLVVELIQFALAIGVADITDVIMNTLGGTMGLAGYAALVRHTNESYLDRCILVFGTLILLAVLYLRIFVFIVRY